MNDARTVSSIFYSVEMATGKGPADHREISTLADGINHAVPTHKELQSSLAWLANAGFVSKSSGGYSLTENGKALIAEARSKFDTIMKIWASLTLEMERIDKESSNPAFERDAAKARRPSTLELVPSVMAPYTQHTQTIFIYYEAAARFSTAGLIFSYL